MSRASRHREKYRLASVISRVDDDEGTAARTRPFSFDEIMSRRKNRKLPVNEKEGCFEETPGNVVIGKISNISAPERCSGQSRDSSRSVQKHLSEENMKASSRKKEEKASFNDGHLVKHKDKETRDSKNKLKGNDKDLRTDAKGRIEERVHGKRVSNEWPSNYYRDEAAKKHSRGLESDRHMGRSREKSERESKRKHRDGVDEKSRDTNAMKKNDLGKGHDSETSERKEGKDSSKSHYEEMRLKRRRSRSQEHENKNRRSISLSPKAYKRGSYREKDYVDVSSHFSKGRSGRQHTDIDRSKGIFNGSSSQYRRHSGSTSGLGGYSPRKRRTEASVKIPSPLKRSPEKRSAKWDIAPEGKDSTFTASIPADFLSLNKITSSVIGELVNAVPVASTTFKSPSGILASALSTSKNASIDSIQLTQATRPMRRLYMENLPASSSEKAVVELLNNFLISSGANHIQGTQPCINCIINKEKGQALVEFLTPEDASAALSFDGSMFLGSIIKIRRPKDFVEVASGEPEKSVVAADLISDVVNDSPQKIFIGGISKALSSDMFMEIATAFGPLKAFQFKSSEDPNESCAFLEYADHSVTLRACAGLNGIKLGGQVITAVQAIPNVTSSESSRNKHGIPDHGRPLLEKPTEVLKLKNLLDSEALSSLSHIEIEEVLEDVRLECLRFGTVASVNVVKHVANPISIPEACKVDDDKVSSGTQQNLGSGQRNAKAESLEEAIDKKIVEGNSTDDDKPADDPMEDEPCQLKHVDTDIAVVGQACKTISDSQEFLQQENASKDEYDCSSDEATNNVHVKDTSPENKMTDGERSTLEKVSEDLKEAFPDDSVGIILDPIEKEDREELDSRGLMNEALGRQENEELDCRGLMNEAVRTTLDPVEKEDEGKVQTLSDPFEKEDDEEKVGVGHVFEPGCVFVEFKRSEAACTAAHCLHGRLFDDRTVTVEYVALDIYRSRFPK